MNKEQIISIIEQALNIASQKGAYNLQDSAAIFSALQELKIIFNNENQSKQISGKLAEKNEKN